MDELSLDIFKLSSMGFCCSQIMLRLALDMEGKENQDLVRSFHGLCRGIGDAQKTCGVLLGGIGVLGLYAGKGSERAYQRDDFTAMLNDFTEWFEMTFESTQCVDLIGITSFWDQNHQEYKMKCGQLMMSSFIKLQEVLMNHGYNLGERDE